MEPNSLHVACAHCHATNRVPVARLTHDPVCGRCGKPLLDGRRFGIRSIPTLVRLKAGRELARQAGALQAAQIVSFAG